LLFLTICGRYSGGEVKAEDKSTYKKIVMEEKFRKGVFEGLVKEKGWTGEDAAVRYSSNYCEGRVEWVADRMKASFSLTTQKLECWAKVLGSEQEIRGNLFKYMHRRIAYDVKKIFPAHSATGINGGVDGLYFEITSDDPEAIVWGIIRLQLRCDRVVTVALEQDGVLRAKVLSDSEDVVKRIVNEDIFGDGK
jgi:hypothetical protein